MSDLPLIFVVGASRSGTTMLNHILGENSNILSLNELHFVGNDWDLGRETSWDAEKARQGAAKLLAIARRSLWQSEATDEEAAEAAGIVESLGSDGIRPVDVYASTLRHLMDLAGRRMVVDQTPRNIYYARDLLNAFPAAKFIHMVRDPRAVLFSQRNRWRQKWLGADFTPLSSAIRVRVNYHPITASRLWSDAYDLGESLVDQPRFRQLRFEKLVTDPQPELQELCVWLGVEFQAEMLAAPNVGSSSSQHKAGDLGIVADTADRWRGQLSEADTWICQWRTKMKQKSLGYTAIDVGRPVFAVLLQLLLYPIHAIGVLLINPRLASKIWAARSRVFARER